MQEKTAQIDQALQNTMPPHKVAQSLEIDPTPYYGSHAIPIANGDPLPAQLEQPGAVVMTFARPVTLDELARMVQSVTGIRAATAEAAATSGAANTADVAFAPSDGEEVSGGRIVWQGRLSDLLNQAADVFHANWTYDDGVITFAEQITRTFMLHALAGDVTLKGNVATGTAGADSGGALPQVSIDSNSSLKVWDEIQGAIKTIMGDSSGSAAYSPSTGSITVTASPEIVHRVEDYLNQQNKLRLRRVAVAVKVISVTLTKGDDYETDLSGIIQRAFGEAGLEVASETLNDTAGLAFTIEKDKGSTGNGTAFPADKFIGALRLSKGVQNAAIAHSGALMTLSDQPAPLQIGRQTTYLARTSSTSGDTSSVSLEPGTVNTGLMMTVLPRVVEENKILMRLSLSISDLTSMGSFGTDSNKIQTPEIETTGFLQNAVMTSGETMVLAGFEKESNNTDVQGAPGPLALLQSRNVSGRTRTATVLILTSQILPEEPMTVIGDQ